MDKGEIIIYQTSDGQTELDVRLEDDTVWLSQAQMAKLLDVKPQNITMHIRNVYNEGELEQSATCKDFLQVQNEGGREVRRERKFYNLDMILAVGYRVRSNVGIHFRRWASGVLTEYMKKGFVLNDERLRNPKEFGADYFDELLERIRDIRASEKRVYQKVKEIFALSVDYDSRSDTAQNFYKSVQNKLEYAATGHTAPEIIAARADASKDNMGLTSFKGSKVRKSDVTVAKNYMDHEEISTLNLIVNMYLDYAELQAKQHHAMHMADWEIKLNQFLQFNGRDVLQDFGTVKREVAEALAVAEYEKYDAHRRAVETEDLSELTSGVKKLKS